METVKKLRDLWRHRRYVAGVCVVAVLAGMLVAYQPAFPPKSKSYDVGIATAQILVDEPNSQAIVGASSAVTPSGDQMLGTLATQANLLADLMVEGTIKADIAQRAGLQPSQLVGVSAAVTVPSASGSASGPTSVSVPSGPNVFALTTQILTDTAGDTTFPIIEIDAQAPDRAKAVQLANAAVAGLQAFVNSQAANERIPDANRLSIMSFGISQATTQTHGSSPLIGFVVALVVLLLGCVSILWILAVIRGWRGASERERLGEPSEDEAEWEPYELAPRVDPARDRVVAANGVSQSDVPTNGAPGKSKHGGPAPAADYPSVPIGDTSGQEPASSPHQWSSRRLLTGSRVELLERNRKLTPRLKGSLGHGSAERRGQPIDEEGQDTHEPVARSNGDDAKLAAGPVVPPPHFGPHGEAGRFGFHARGDGAAGSARPGT
jgi:hypothetical protein